MKQVCFFNEPESLLPDVFRMIVQTRTTGARLQVAVRWFNRLFYDVHKWNKEFVAFLRTHPDYASSSLTREQYDKFEHERQAFSAALDESTHEVKRNLCANLRHLGARFERDFNWLRREQPDAYDDLMSFVQQSYSSEVKIIYAARHLCEMVEARDFTSYDSGQPTESFARVRIEEYAKQSAKYVAELGDLANEARVRLLTVEEYEAALNGQGTSEALSMVINDITNYTQNVSDSVVGALAAGPGSQAHGSAQAGKCGTSAHARTDHDADSRAQAVPPRHLPHTGDRVRRNPGRDEGDPGRGLGGAQGDGAAPEAEGDAGAGSEPRDGRGNEEAAGYVRTG